MEKKYFGTLSSGEKVYSFTLKNSHGMSAVILSYGCIIKEINFPVASGSVNTVLGYDNLEGYENGTANFGAFVGRFANRIGLSRFTLNGKEYTLVPNEGRNHLHGAYRTRIYDYSIDGETLVFKHTSPDGDEGFPGELRFEVRYTLTEDNALEIEYKAHAGGDTVINFTNHSYFNLNGDHGTILNHTLWMDCDSYTEIDSEKIPTGRLIPVEGTPMDFRTPKKVGTDIASSYQAISSVSGYDHNFTINGWNGCKSEIVRFASLTGDVSGIKMDCYTDQCGVQLYTGNVVDTDKAPERTGSKPYPKYGALCLETQHYPDSPNHPDFPDTVIRAGEDFHSRTVYRFSVLLQ